MVQAVHKVCSRRGGGCSLGWVHASRIERQREAEQGRAKQVPYLAGRRSRGALHTVWTGQEVVSGARAYTSLQV